MIGGFRSDSRAWIGGRLTLVLVAGSLVFAACGGGGSTKAASVASTNKSSSAGPSGAAATASAAQFCHDYGAASIDYSKTSGDVNDPSFTDFLTALAKAQAEAPASVKADVTGMLNEAKKVKKSNGTGDLTSYSEQISSWANSNCQ